MLDALARVARQVALYGPAHRVSEVALERACRELAGAAGGQRLEIRAQQDGLVLNGEQLGAGNPNVVRFHTSMRDRLITAIEFGPRVRSDDLGRLLEILSEEPEDVLSRGGAVVLFGHDGGCSIRIEEFDFTKELLVSETAWRQLQSTMMSEEAGGLREVISSCAESLTPSGEESRPGEAGLAVGDLEEDIGEHGAPEAVVSAAIARLIQRSGENACLGDEESWRAWQEEMARRLGALSPTWRARIFRAAAEPCGDCPDMLACIAGELDAADCVSLVLDHPDSIQAEKSAGLAVALRRIMADAGRRAEIEALLHERALAGGVSEEVYQNVVGLLVSRVSGVARTEPTNVMSNSRAEDATERDPVGGEQDLQDLMATMEPQAVRWSRLQMLGEVLHTELTVRQYGTVISLLTKAAEECSALGDADGLLSVLSSLRQEARQGSDQDASRRVVAGSALARAGSEETITCLISLFEDASAEARREVIAALGLLGESGMDALVKIAETGAEGDLRSIVDTMLGNDAPVFLHLREIISQAHGDRARELLDVVIDKARTVTEITMATRDADTAAQLELVRLVAAKRRTDSADVLISLLSDCPLTVRLAAIDGLAELRAEAGVPVLCDIVAVENDFGDGARLREAAIRALGAIGSGRAVPALCEVLQRGAFLRMLGSPRPRVAAAEALGILGGPDARFALEQGTRSMHRAVREACQSALARLRAREIRPAEGRRHAR